MYQSQQEDKLGATQGYVLTFLFSCNKLLRLQGVMSLNACAVWSICLCFSVLVWRFAMVTDNFHSSDHLANCEKAQDLSEDDSVGG